MGPFLVVLKQVKYTERKCTGIYRSHLILLYNIFRTFGAVSIVTLEGIITDTCLKVIVKMSGIN